MLFEKIGPIAFLFGIWVLASCSSKQATDTDNIKMNMDQDTVILVLEEIPLEEQLVDSNAKLVAYFEDYCKEKGAEVQPHWSEEEQIVKVWSAI